MLILILWILLSLFEEQKNITDRRNKSMRTFVSICTEVWSGVQFTSRCWSENQLNSSLEIIFKLESKEHLISWFRILLRRIDENLWLKMSWFQVSYFSLSRSMCWSEMRLMISLSMIFRVSRSIQSCSSCICAASFHDSLMNLKKSITLNFSSSSSSKMQLY